MAAAVGIRAAAAVAVVVDIKEVVVTAAAAVGDVIEAAEEEEEGDITAVAAAAEFRMPVGRAEVAVVAVVEEGATEAKEGTKRITAD